MVYKNFDYGFLVWDFWVGYLDNNYTKNLINKEILVMQYTC